MTRYAAGTKVSANRSRDEIEKVLTRYGADKFAYGWENERAVIAFRANDRHIRFILPMSSRDALHFTETGRERSEGAMEKAFDQAVRQHWRALALVIKAKLEAVESGIVEFEEEFLAHIIIMPDGQTVGQHTRPMIETAYQSGQMQPLLPAPD